MGQHALIVVLVVCGCGASTGLNVPEAGSDAQGDAGDAGVDARECQPERCNGEDDDCDGFPDDGLFCFFLEGDPIEAAARASCGPEWYSYGVPDPESANPSPDIRVSDEVVVAVQAGPGTCGAYLAVIADLPNDGSMGALTGLFQLTEGTIAGVAVGDEPRECGLDLVRQQVRCDWVWQNCCTDGVLLGPFRDDFCIDVTLAGQSGVRRVSALDGPTRQRELSFGERFEICGRFTPER